MSLRYAAVVAGCRSLGLVAAISAFMSTAAVAAPIMYNVSFDLPELSNNSILSVTGTITTDGKIGVISSSDISSVDVIFDGMHADTFRIADPFGDGPVQSSKDGKLSFTFSNSSTENGDRLIFQNGNNPFIQFFSKGGYNVIYAYDSSVLATTKPLLQNEKFVFATTAVSAVPLPASAPMFGAALMALDAVGYGVKRKKAAAAA